MSFQGPRTRSNGMSFNDVKMGRGRPRGQDTLSQAGGFDPRTGQVKSPPNPEPRRAGSLACVPTLLRVLGSGHQDWMVQNE